MIGPPSLRARLLLAATLSILAALMVTGLYLSTSFSSSIEADRRSDLQASLDRVIAAVDPDAPIVVPEGPLRDPRYDTPLSGVYWQVEDLDTGEVVRSRSLWDTSLPVTQVREGTARLDQASTSDGTMLIVLSQLIRIERNQTERHFSIAVAEERRDGEDPVIHFGFTLMCALALLGAILIMAAAVQIHFGLLPLSVLRRDINAVRRGEAKRLPDKYSGELLPVTHQINDLLDAQEASMVFARERAADLAHGLKTPLAILSATADRLRENGDSSNADVIRMLSEQMNSRVDYQLRLARLRYRTRAQGVTASLSDVVLRSVAVLRKSHSGERLNWVVQLSTFLVVRMDEHDLMELIGVVLENAAQWAAERVTIRGHQLGGETVLVIEDDGVGLTDEQIGQLGIRGTRLDESMSGGDGLGLAIAFEIVRLNSGTIAVSRSASGASGLLVTIVLQSSEVDSEPSMAGAVEAVR